MRLYFRYTLTSFPVFTTGVSAVGGNEITAGPSLPSFSLEVFHVFCSTEALEDSDNTDEEVPKCRSYASIVSGGEKWFQ